MSPEEKVPVTVQVAGNGSKPGAEAKGDVPSPKRRGRPPGSKNKAKSKGTARSKTRTAKGAGKNRGGVLRLLPSMPFQEALTIGEAIQKHASGQEIRRLTLFQKLGKGADSSLSRALVTNSAKYGITVGHHSADKLSMTPDGFTATNPDALPEDRFRARVKLAIQDVPPFNALYERFKGKLPSQEVMRDFLVDQGYDEDIVPQLVESFILNAKHLNLLQEIAGAERLLPIDHVLEEIAKQPRPGLRAPTVPEDPVSRTEFAEKTDWNKICFYVTPIGEPESPERRHSDLFLSHIIEPALQEFGLRVVRADAITEPGMVTRQVLEHVVRAKLVVTDFSFHNGSVLYEACLRHVVRKPIVHIIRHGDKVPFDVNQFRTIMIDNRDIYTLLPKLESYKAEIANQVRRALEDPDSVENPITTFFPGLEVTIPS